jgi:hypothetical protein
MGLFVEGDEIPQVRSVEGQDQQVSEEDEDFEGQDPGCLMNSWNPIAFERMVEVSFVFEPDSTRPSIPPRSN